MIATVLSREIRIKHLNSVPNTERRLNLSIYVEHWSIQGAILVKSTVVCIQALYNTMLLIFLSWDDFQTHISYHLYYHFVLTSLNKIMATEMLD